MPDNTELTVRLHPVAGDDVSVMTRDFAGEDEALSAIARALDERHSLVLARARYNREAGEHGVVINMANVVSVVVLKTDTTVEATGQYM
jgi:hypothetical protein